MSATLQDEIAALGRDRITQLRSLPPAALRDLPKSRSEEVVVRGKKVMLTIYRDFWDERALFVVQIYRRVFLCYGRMFVLGFTLGSDDQITEAEPTMLSDYS